MRPILVTGATGTVGRQVIAQLLAANVRVRALTRSPHSANLPAEVEIVSGDLTNPSSLDRCLNEVETIFLLWTAPATTVPAALERIVRYTPRIVFLSAPHRTAHPFFQQRNPMAAMHAEIERLIESSGVAWTFLRPGMFAANVLQWWAPRIRSGNVVRWPYANAPTAPIHERDIGAVAARLLCDDIYIGKDYVVTGPESLTQADQVRIIGEVTGRSLTLDEMTPEEAQRELSAEMPAPIVRMLLNAWAAAVGQPAFITHTVADITGAPARTFRQWVADHRAAFLP
jgi:uncharacterized protein YbjT (DUF2867 family)